MEEQANRGTAFSGCLRFSALAALLLLCSTTTWSQAITGTVKDSSGAVLPGVTVVASSPALIEQTRATVSDSQGQYRLIDLRPGTYSVTCSLQGFNSARRDGIELSADFTATVDIDMTVGSVQQTVEVSAAAPLVDVSDVNAETNLSQTLVYTSPESHNILGFSALTVGAVIPQTAQDVGGSKGEISVRLAFHGGHAIEQKLLLNGMVYNTLLSVGNRTFFPNPASTEEFTITNGMGGSSEVLAAGAQVNTVSIDGGNDFHGSFYTDDTSSSLQGTNVTPALQVRGLVNSSAGIAKIYDYNAGLGGAILKNHLWFFAGYRNWGDSERSASLQYDANPNSYTFTPNGVAVVQHNLFRNENLHLTWQATQKDKLTYSMDYENDCLCNAVGGNLFSSSTAVEASQGGLYHPNHLFQITWIHPVNAKLLFEAGMTIYQIRFLNFSPGNAASNGISVTDTGTGLTYRAPTSLYTLGLDPQQNYRFSVSYVTGEHNYKVGMYLLHGYLDETVVYNSQAISYTFKNGSPTGLTEYVSPLHTRWVDWPTLGIYYQDQWTIKRRLTVSYGARFDHQGDYIPQNSLPAGVFVPARTFPEVTCVPCWYDLSPRVGASYDLFGTGRTAIKASIGRYVLSQTTGLASSDDPANTTVSSTTRSWMDNNGNFIPDCNLANPVTNGECGPDSNVKFGQNVVTTAYDPSVLNGWFHRPYNWQLSAGLEHQLTSDLAVSAMYFRTWYGNFTVTNNLDTPPADYSPYCVTAPSNTALPGGGGNKICGLYDLNPAQAGQVNNLVTFSSKFGRQTEIYNGVDLVFTARMKRLQLSGGVNFGDTNGVTSSQSNCFVVNSPQQLYQCSQPFPYQTQLKLQGSYKLPWGFEVAATQQSLPGIPITSTWAAPNSSIASSLGRNLSACPSSTGSCSATASVSLILPQSEFEGRINQTDIRFTKTVRLGKEGRFALQGIADLDNLFNASPILSENTTYGMKWRTPTSILDPRLAKFGAKFTF